MEIKKFTEPILIKAGSKSLGLGLKHTPPMCDVRILSEVNYQKLKKAYDEVEMQKEEINTSKPPKKTKGNFKDPFLKMLNEYF